MVLGEWHQSVLTLHSQKLLLRGYLHVDQYTMWHSGLFHHHQLGHCWTRWYKWFCVITSLPTRLWNKAFFPESNFSSDKGISDHVPNMRQESYKCISNILHVTHSATDDLLSMLEFWLWVHTIFQLGSRCPPPRSTLPRRVPARVSEPLFSKCKAASEPWTLSTHIWTKANSNNPASSSTRQTSVAREGAHPLRRLWLTLHHRHERQQAYNSLLS